MNFHKLLIPYRSNIGTHVTILDEAAKFGIKYGITLVEPMDDGCEFYFLGSTIDDKAVS